MSTIRNRLEEIPIGDFCQTGSGGTPSRSKASRYFGGSIPWVKSGELRETVITETEESITKDGLKESAAKLLPVNTLLVALYGATVGRIGVLGVEAATNQAVCYIIPDERRADRKYLFYALQSKVPVWLSQRVGGGQPNISQGIIKDTKIPMPPLSEQKRIANILDKADAIRRKRQEAAAEANALRQSIFLKLFGDPATNTRGWQESEFADILSGGMRNGISPSRTGRRTGKVLVLSAITGQAFDRAAIKESTFADPLNKDQLVNDKDLLICRGNGNIQLVGAGRFPTASMDDTVFPDTMIAAKIDSTRVVPEYLEALWTTRHIRYQIESGARTTNGTYKVNQGVLSTIKIPLPPLAEQQQYASSIQTIRRFHTRLQSKEADDLFYSLVQRAFKGELEGNEVGK